MRVPRSESSMGLPSEFEISIVLIRMGLASKIGHNKTSDSRREISVRRAFMVLP